MLKIMQRQAATPGRSTLLVPWGQGSNTGSTLLPLILFHVSSGVGMLVVGGVVAEVKAGHKMAKKKKAHLERGQQGTQKKKPGKGGFGNSQDQKN